jgi:hypothetical protein
VPGSPLHQQEAENEEPQATGAEKEEACSSLPSHSAMETGGPAPSTASKYGRTLEE